MLADCSTDVLVSFTESLHIHTGLLAVAAVCGGLAGSLAAALLYVCCLRHALLTRQVSDTGLGRTRVTEAFHTRCIYRVILTGSHRQAPARPRRRPGGQEPTGLCEQQQTRGSQRD